MKEVQKFLKECGVYYLATVSNNTPKVRPFGTAEIYNDHLYIQTGKNKDVYKQVMENNNVELCGFKDNEWIRVSGRLVLDDSVEAKKDMLDKNPNLRSMYNELDNNTAVLYFENGEAIIYSFTDEPRVIKF